MTSSFTKVCVYNRPHANAKIVFSRILKMSGEYKVCDVTVYESMRLRPSIRRRETAFSKVSTLESVLECMRLG